MDPASSGASRFGFWKVGFSEHTIRSAETRCGKSRVLGLLARAAFNASPVTAPPTEALLYRGAARSAGVQLFDEVEMLRGDGKRFDGLITVLNVGFERGGVVMRLEHRGDQYVECRTRRSRRACWRASNG